MSRHLDLERIVDLARGVAAASEAESGHLTGCDRCARAARWARGVADAAAVGPLESPPASAVERAIALADERPRPRARWSPARLLPDAFARPELAGVRSGGPVSGRRLYEADRATLDVELASSPADPERWRITAQLERSGEPPAGDVLAVLWRGEAVFARAEGDATDVFAFDGVAPGTYRLEAWSPAAGAAVRIESLELPETE